MRKNIAKAYGVPLNFRLNHLSEFINQLETGKITEDKFWKDFSKILNKPQPKEKYFLWRKPYLTNLRMHFELYEYIKKLKEKGYKIAVLSNTMKPQSEIFNLIGGYKGFDEVILSHEAHLIKPDHKIYELLAKKLNFKMNECVFIDDDVKNILAAKKLGIQTILALYPKQIIFSLNKLIETQ